MRKLKYALIGCGRIAPNHIAAAVENVDKIDIVAVCDIVPEKLEEILNVNAAISQISSSVARYTDYKELLEKEKPNFVAIATESGNHAKIAIDCLNAGCNLIIEKPIALSINDADEIIALADEKGLVLCACHQNRFNKSVQKIRKTLEAGKFGKLLHGAAHIRWNRAKDYYTQAPWRGNWDQDGGTLMNQCIHNIDLLRWVMGDEVDEVFAYTDNLNHPYIEGEDLGLALVKFKNGAYGIIEGTANVFDKNLEETLYVFGETGTVKAGGKSVNIIEEWIIANDDEGAEEVKLKYAENPPNVYGYGHSPLYADVISAIIDGRKPYIDGKAGRNALELVLAIYKSALEGKPVKLPITDFSTTDMVGIFDGLGKG